MRVKQHTHPVNGPFSETTWVSRYQKGKTNLDFTEARDSEWQSTKSMFAKFIIYTEFHTDMLKTL